MSGKNCRHKKRAYKNVTIYYIIVSSEKKADEKVTKSQKIALISAITSLISAILGIILRLMG